MKEKDFLEAYEMYSDALYRHCYFRLFDNEKSKDIVQETFVRTWNYILEGKEISNIRAFLYRVLNNLIVDEIRKKKSYSLEDLSESGFQPTDNKAGKQRLEVVSEVNHLMKFINKLGEEKRQLLIMRYMDGLGPKEISRILGKGENIISVRLNRAIKELREIYDNG